MPDEINELNDEPTLVITDVEGDVNDAPEVPEVPEAKEPDDEELDRQAAEWLKSRGKLPAGEQKQEPVAQKTVEPPNPWDDGYSEWVADQAEERMSAKATVVHNMIAEMRKHEPDLPDAELAAIRAQLMRPEYKLHALENMYGSKSHHTIAESAYRRLERAGKIDTEGVRPQSRTPVTPKTESKSSMDSASKKLLEQMNSKVDPRYRLTEEDLKGAL